MTVVAEWQREICVDNGWRFLENLSPHRGIAHDRIVALYEEYDEDSIYIGAQYDSVLMRAYTPRRFGGVYLRDVDELVAELEEDVLNWNCGHPLAVL